MADLEEFREQLGLDRPVALKILSPELAGDEAATARLRREATIGARLRHRQVLHPHRFGRPELVHDDGLHLNRPGGGISGSNAP